MPHFATIRAILKPARPQKFWGLGCLSVLLLVFSVTPTAILLEQSTSLPALFHLRGARTPPDNIAIIALNARAHSNLSLPSPHSYWPRTLLADTITSLKAAGAKLIVLDIAFREARDPAQDTALAAAIARAGNVLLFTYLKREQVMMANGFVDIEQAVPPLTPFYEAALGTGSFTLPKESTVYHTSLIPSLEGVESQPVAVLRHYAPEKLLQWELISKVYINFYGPARTLPIWDIDEWLLNQDALAPHFQNAIVYVGFVETAQTEQKDTYSTVFGSELGIDLSGVEISASVVANLLDGSLLLPPSLTSRLAGVAATILLTLLVIRFWPRGIVVAMSAFGVGVGLVSFWAFKHAIWVPAVLYSCSAAILALAQVITRFMEQKAALKRVQFALSQHMPDHAAQKLSHTLVALEQEHKLVCGVCLVTDIRGFTALAETLDPDALHRLMNQYYAELVEAVNQHQGFVGNIVGDSLLALWSGPTINPELCQRAFACAENIRTRLAAHPAFATQLPTCMALHAGQFSLGHLGATGHFEYSPVGDMINTATRIEHFTRTLNTEFLCSESVATQLQQVQSPPPLLYLGPFTMRNRSAPTRLYSTETSNQVRAMFNAALHNYKNQNANQAKHMFETLVSNHNHGPSQYYLKLVNLKVAEAR